MSDRQLIHYADTHPAALGIDPDGYVMIHQNGGWKRMADAMHPPSMSRLVLALRYQDRPVIEDYVDYTEWRDSPPEHANDRIIATVKDFSGNITVTTHASVSAHELITTEDE